MEVDPVCAKWLSQRKKTPNNGTLATRAIHAHAGQPASLPSMKGRENRKRASDKRTVPTGSSRGGFSDCDSFSRSQAATTVASPIGTLIKKIGRQPKFKMLA